MVVKSGRYGKFLACPNFPECREYQAYRGGSGCRLPQCGSSIVARIKRGRKFYGCDNLSQLYFVSWDPLVKDNVRIAAVI